MFGTPGADFIGGWTNFIVCAVFVLVSLWVWFALWGTKTGQRIKGKAENHMVVPAGKWYQKRSDRTRGIIGAAVFIIYLITVYTFIIMM